MIILEVNTMKILETPWTKDALSGDTLTEYPRPGLKRREWIDLNGQWNYIITDKRILPSQFYGETPFPYDGVIRVPFSPEAPLSGVGRQVMPEETLWYSQTFRLPENYFDPDKNRLLLHFGAVDQICTVYINGKHAGFHKGGYLPFTLDITEFSDGKEPLRILVAVKDFSDTSYHARGKQKLEAGGMFYTAQSGIWQTVWLEVVPNAYIENLRLTPDYDAGEIRIRVNCSEKKAVYDITCEIFQPQFIGPEGITEKHLGTLLNRKNLTPQKECTISLPSGEKKPWSPDSPWLYPVRICFGEDEIYTYFAMRKCDIRKDKNGTLRFFLNNRPCFQTGILDQGYWPDGLYTAPVDDAMIYDIRTMKSLGFNMLRKHAKIEPERWYFHCDRLGMLVWQDMVNGGSSYKGWFVTYLATLFSWIHISVKDYHHKLLSRESYDGRQEYIDEVRETIKSLYNHPSIVTWVPFNEGWGQFSTRKITKLIHSLDPSRLVDSASGWFDQGCGDIKSLHYYFLRLRVPKDKRVVALSEFGGYSRRIPEHSACETTYGYKQFSDRQSLTRGYEQLMVNTVLPAARNGVSASVYTQLSDIEEEVNGILTYDRKEMKMNPLVVQKWNARLKKIH